MCSSRSHTALPAVRAARRAKRSRRIARARVGVRHVDVPERALVVTERHIKHSSKQLHDGLDDRHAVVTIKRDGAEFLAVVKRRE